MSLCLCVFRAVARKTQMMRGHLYLGFVERGNHMKAKEVLGIDRLRNRYSKEELPVSLATQEGCSGPSILPTTAGLGSPERIAAKARLPLILVVSLLFAAVLLTLPVASPAQVSVGVSVTFGAPALPVYVQPPCPSPGFIWVPGYWAWDPDFGYYWVPGMWVLPPFPGALWTPGYWVWSDGVYIWYEGYWGPVVGYYGGINYGYGYTGYGYDGGYWSSGAFYYNRTVNNISETNITTVYSRPVRNAAPAGASFNGGPGGTTVRPTSEQLAAARGRRSSLTGAQSQQMQTARADPRQRATVNRGRPAIAATARPGEFTGHDAVSASRAGAPYKEPPVRKAAPGESARTPKPGAGMRPSVRAPERVAPGAPQRGLERRGQEPRTEQRRSETTKPLPKEEGIKGKAVTPPQGAAPERVAPGAPQGGLEQRSQEPRTEQRQPETTKPSPEKEKGKREEEEPPR